MPRVTLVVPVYNVELYLEQCLRSAMTQTVRDIEIVVVNDGSPDGSQAIIDRLAGEDPRIVSIVQENGGYGKAVNTGIARATGDYLMVLESDDFLDPFALEVLLDRADRGSYDIIKGGFIREFSDGNTGRFSLEALTGRYEGEVRPTASPQVMTMESSIWSALHRLDFIRDQGITMLESRGAAYQDLVWKFETFALAKRVYFVDYPVYHYRVLALGSSSRNDKNPLVHFENYRQLRERLTARGQFSDVIAGLYYAHNLMDFRFHLGRLNDSGQRTFAAQGRAVLAEAADHLRRHGALTDDPYFNGWLRRYIRDSAHLVGGPHVRAVMSPPADTPRWRRMLAPLKKPVVRVAAPAVRSRLARGLVSSYRGAAYAGAPRGTETVPVASMPLGFAGRNALVVMPWSDENGSARIVDELNAGLRALGYWVHVVVYNGNGGNPRRGDWDYFYDLPRARDFGRLHTLDGELALDGNTIDEWVGDDLAQFVRTLDTAWNFDVVVCHYVFLSRIFEFIGDSAARLLVTHDQFAGRNTRFAEMGMTDSLFFSTTEPEEARGLARAEHVIALQERESEYFSAILADTPAQVHTLPLLESPRFLDTVPADGAPLRVGFIGSSYVNNKTALVNFFDQVGEAIPPSLEFVIAGRICDVLTKGDLPRGVRLLGEVDDLAEFYANVDVVFNPDYFESGRKIKVFEGLSFGVPVVTTPQATVGFDALPPFMKLGDNPQILQQLRAFADDPVLYAAARSDAQATYTALTETFGTLRILSTMLDSRTNHAQTPEGGVG